MANLKISPDLRQKILAEVQQGKLSIRAVARKHGVPHGTISFWTWKERNPGHPRANGGKNPVGRHRKTSKDIRARAVEVANRIGGRAAAKELGLEARSIYRWQYEARQGRTTHNKAAKKAPYITASNSEHPDTWISGFRIGFAEGLAFGARKEGVE